MQAAKQAMGKILHHSGEKDTTVEQDVAPAVQHETITRANETKEQEVVDREKHQHHFHTTVQPLKDGEVKETQHGHETAPTQYREINNDATGAEVKAKVDGERNGFKSQTVQDQAWEKNTQEGTVVGEHVHHHVHETVQPVIEKETIMPSVMHKTKPVKEVVQEQSLNHGTTTNTAIPVGDFKAGLEGSKTATRVEQGAPRVGA